MYALFWLATWSLSLIWLRLEWSHSPRYQWLYWDVFLAFVPLVLAVLLERAWQRRRRWLSAVLFVPWLLFFPNAPYLVTEFIHLRIPDAAPHWLDIVMLMSVAATGIVAGALSLERVLAIVEQAWLRLPLELILCLACGFGIYLGRYERWNSWDVIQAPHALLADLAGYVLHPAAHRQVWLISGVFAVSVFCLQRCVVNKIDPAGRRVHDA
jgi:uncharacterized membrane protein